MSALPHERDYEAVADPELALKYAIKHHGGDRVQIIEGVIVSMAPTWGHESIADDIRDQIGPKVRELGLAKGSGDVDLPGSPNWYIPDLAVIPAELATRAKVLPSETLFIVEVTSESDADTDRIVKRRRYAEYGAPLYLLVDRQERACTLFSAPGELGCTRVDGPHPFGTGIRLPEPFGIVLATDRF